MSKVPSSRVMASGLFAVLAAGVLSSAVGCAKPEEPKKQAWSCATGEVPMGEVVRCTSSAMTADGPVGGSATGSTTDGTTTDGTPIDRATTGGTTGGTTDGTTGGTSDGSTDGTTGGTSDGSTDGTTGGVDSSGDVVYQCTPGNDNPDCPPSDGVSTDGSTSGGTSDGTGTGTGGGTSDGTSDGTSTGGSSGGGAGSSGGGAGSSGGGGDKRGTQDGSRGGSQRPGPDECAFIPDLEYCHGGSGGSGDGSTGTSSSSSSSGAGGGATGGEGSTESDCTNARGTCLPPGKSKGGTTDGTGASSGGSSSGGSTDGTSSSSGGGASGGTDGKEKGGKSFTCKKDKKGNKSCITTPNCAPGSHPSACGACQLDSDGADDCVAPAQGGCWVTGGGFIEGDSLTPAAAADGHDNFGGNAKPMKKGGVKGHWNHVDHGTGNHAKGRPEYIMCRTTDGPGPGQPGGKKGLVANQVYFGGHAQWRTAEAATWSDGYWFDVVAEDHGEPGNTRALKNGEMPDSYHFTIRKIDDPTKGASGVVVYETRGDLSGGNIQLHPSNNGHPALSSPLPAWVSIEQ